MLRDGPAPRPSTVSAPCEPTAPNQPARHSPRALPTPDPTRHQPTALQEQAARHSTRPREPPRPGTADPPTREPSPPSPAHFAPRHHLQLRPNHRSHPAHRAPRPQPTPPRGAAAAPPPAPSAAPSTNQSCGNEAHQSATSSRTYVRSPPHYDRPLRHLQAENPISHRNSELGGRSGPVAPAVGNLHGPDQCPRPRLAVGLQLALNRGEAVLGLRDPGCHEHRCRERSRP